VYAELLASRKDTEKFWGLDVTDE